MHVTSNITMAEMIILTTYKGFYKHVLNVEHFVENGISDVFINQGSFMVYV